MKHPSFTEEQLTDALHSLKPDTSDMLFEKLTYEPPKKNHRPWLWYSAAAAAVAAVVACIFLLWPKEQEEHPAIAEVKPETTKEVVVTPETQPVAVVAEEPTPRKKKAKRVAHSEPTPQATETDELSQLLAQTDAEQAQAQEQREQMSDIVDQYIAFVEP
jgi:hypothetical protein